MDRCGSFAWKYCFSSAKFFFFDKMPFAALQNKNCLQRRSIKWLWFSLAKKMVNLFVIVSWACRTNSVVSIFIIFAYLVNDFSGSFDTTCSSNVSFCWRYLRLVVVAAELLLALSSLRFWYTQATPYRSFESLIALLNLLPSFAEVSEDLILPLRLIIEAGFRIVQSRTDSNKARILICRFSSGWSNTQSLEIKIQRISPFISKYFYLITISLGHKTFFFSLTCLSSNWGSWKMWRHHSCLQGFLSSCYFPL